MCTFWTPVFKPSHLCGYTGVSGKEDVGTQYRGMGREKGLKNGYFCHSDPSFRRGFDEKMSENGGFFTDFVTYPKSDISPPGPEIPVQNPHPCHQFLTLAVWNRNGSNGPSSFPRVPQTRGTQHVSAGGSQNRSNHTFLMGSKGVENTSEGRGILTVLLDFHDFRTKLVIFPGSERVVRPKVVKTCQNR